MSYAPIQFSIRRPLLDLNTCSAITGRSAKELHMAIESGEVLYAFNIGTMHKREVRVLATSVRDYVEGAARDPSMDTPARLRVIVSELFPPIEWLVELCNLARVLSCNGGHIDRLIQRGFLKCHQKARGTGPGSSAKITRASVIDFLCSRRLLP